MTSTLRSIEFKNTKINSETKRFNIPPLKNFPNSIQLDKMMSVSREGQVLDIKSPKSYSCQLPLLSVEIN